MKRKIIVTIALVLMALILCIIFYPSYKYNKAIKLYNNHDYVSAQKIFESLSEYKNSAEYYTNATDFIDLKKYFYSEGIGNAYMYCVENMTLREIKDAIYLSGNSIEDAKKLVDYDNENISLEQRNKLLMTALHQYYLSNIEDKYISDRYERLISCMKKNDAFKNMTNNELDEQILNLKDSDILKNDICLNIAYQKFEGLVHLTGSLEQLVESAPHLWGIDMNGIATQEYMDAFFGR